MNRKVIKPFLTIAVLLGAIPAASAHVGPGAGHHLTHGLAHPFLGWDHLLAMLAVGLWAAQQGGRALWLFPAGFVGALAAGLLLGAMGLGLPAAAFGVAISAVLIGLFMATTFRFPLGCGVMIVALLGLCHGHAHGAALPAAAPMLTYGLGLTLATAGLHALGVALGQLPQAVGQARWLQVTGCLLAVFGVLIALGQ